MVNDSIQSEVNEVSSGQSLFADETRTDAVGLKVGLAECQTLGLDAISIFDYQYIHSRPNVYPDSYNYR